MALLRRFGDKQPQVGEGTFLAETAAKFISPGAQEIAYDPPSVYASDPGAPASISGLYGAANFLS